jgi:hypothetical protein
MNEINVVAPVLKEANPTLSQSLIQTRILMGEWLSETFEECSFGGSS